MRIVNRAGDTVTYLALETPQNLFREMIRDCQWIYGDQVHSKGMGVDRLKFLIKWGTTDVFGMRFEPYDYDSATSFANTTTVLLVNPPGGALTVVDWNATKKGRIDDLAKLEDGSDAMEKGRQVGLILIDALAKGLGALGPGGNVAGGLAIGVGSLLLMALDSQEEEPPSPPTIEDIQDAVRAVIEEELRESKSEDIAAVFQAAGNWLVMSTRLAYAQLTGNGPEPATGSLSDHDEVDFRRRLEAYLDPMSDFQHGLHLMHSHPEIGLFLLPELVTGLAADLQMRRMHLMLRHLDGARIVDLDVDALRGQVDTSVASLEASLAAFVARRDSDLKKTKVHKYPNGDVTPEGVELEQMFNKKYTGMDTLEFAEGAIEQLVDIGRGLEEEALRLRADEPPTKIWDRSWDRPGGDTGGGAR